MIKIKRGWFEWDFQIGTFRGSYDGVIYGTYTGQYVTAEQLDQALGNKLSDLKVATLNEEKIFYDDLKRQQDEEKQWAQ